MTPQGESATEHAERLQQLADAAAQLAAAETVAEVGEVVVDRIAPVVQAVLAVVMIQDEDELVVLTSVGLSPHLRERWQRFPLSVDTPASRAALERRPVILTEADEINEAFPALDGAAPPSRTVICLPMTTGIRCWGVLALSFEAAWDAPAYELHFFSVFAECAAQTISRIHAYAEAAQRARRLAFLADASAELASSLDYRTTLQKVAQLAVPDLADWCAVSLVEDGELHSVAVAHKDPAKVEWALQLERRYPPRMDTPTGAGNVVRTGVSELHTEITDEMLQASAVDEEHLRLARELGLRSVLVVPLVARGNVLGAITMIRAETPGVYGPEDLAVAEDLAGRAALAIDNSRLYTKSRDVALQLQRAVLPERLDRMPGWRVAARYLPGHHAEVGGDFYDTIPLADGRIAVFIGDVMGHGVQAAAAMAAMRASVRAYASIDPEPDVVMGKLDRMFERLQIAQLVTLVYATLDAAQQELAFVNAGHHAPLIVSGTGEARMAGSPPARPLGAGGQPRARAAVPFRPDDTLLLYTDGLIERRGEVIDEGIARLVTAAPRLAAPDLDAALAEIVEGFEQNPFDDVTAIAVRRERT